jgi:hypothetical protein
LHELIKEWVLSLTRTTNRLMNICGYPSRSRINGNATLGGGAIMTII